MSEYEDVFVPGGSVAAEARDGVINAAIAAGKFPEARRAHYAASWDKDPAGTARVIQTLAAVLPPPRSVAAAAQPVDVTYARNPLVEDARARMPALWELAAGEGAPPTLFTNGDLPALTASGMAPEKLLALPWWLRHPVAAADQAGAYQLLEAYAGDPAAAQLYLSADPGNADYAVRVTDWLSGMTREISGERRVAASAVPEDRRAELEGALHDQLWPQDSVAAAAERQRQVEAEAESAADAARRQVLSLRSGQVTTR